MRIAFLASAAAVLKCAERVPIRRAFAIENPIVPNANPVPVFFFHDQKAKT